MKKIGVLFTLILAIFLIGCARTRVSDTFRFESRELEILVGEEKQLDIIMGDIDKDSIIIYTMESNTYDEYGELIPANRIVQMNGSDSTYYYRDTTQGEKDVMKVIGKAIGEIKFTAYLKDSTNVFDTIIINVVGDVLGGYQIQSTSSKVKVGERLPLTMVTYPDGIEEKATYSSSDENIATVSSNGVVVGVNPGTVIISANSIYDSNLTAKKTITVEYAQAEEIKLESSVIDILKDRTYQINAKCLPNNTNQTLTYSSNNKNIATVDANGLVQTVDAGTAIITIKSSDNLVSTTLTVNVSYAGATSISVAEEYKNISIDYLNTSKAYYSVGPINSNQNVTINVLSGSEFVEVSVVSEKEGLEPSYYLNIKGLAIGQAVIEISTENGYYSETINVDVVIPQPESIIASIGNDKLLVGEQSQITASISPSGADQTVLYESSDVTIATVDENGLVTAVSSGEFTITIKDSNSIIEKKISAVVYDLPVAIVVTGIPENNKVDFSEVYEIELEISVSPDTAIQSGWKITIDNENVAEISSDLTTIYINETGTFTITVTLGELSWQQTIEVYDSSK